MPMLTTSVKRAPLAPVMRPSCTPVTNSRIFASSRRTSGMTSCPSTTIGRSERLRSAMCMAARRSVLFTSSPANSASMRSGSLQSRASASSSSIVFRVRRWRVKS